MSKYINIKIRKFVDKEIKGLKRMFLVILRENRIALKLARKELKLRLKRMNPDMFATESDLKSIEKDVEMLKRLVYIGVGGCLLLELISKYIKI